MPDEKKNPILVEATLDQFRALVLGELQKISKLVITDLPPAWLTQLIAVTATLAGTIAVQVNDMSVIGKTAECVQEIAATEAAQLMTLDAAAQIRRAHADA